MTDSTGNKFYLVFSDMISPEVNIPADAPVLNLLDYDFSNTKLIVLNSCESAKGEENLCSALYEAGVECVVGFEKEIESELSYQWEFDFWSAMAAGATVEQAIAYALKEESYPKLSKMNSCKVYGNGNLSLNSLR